MPVSASGLTVMMLQTAVHPLMAASLTCSFISAVSSCFRLLTCIGRKSTTPLSVIFVTTSPWLLYTMYLRHARLSTAFRRRGRYALLLGSSGRLNELCACASAFGMRFCRAAHAKSSLSQLSNKRLSLSLLKELFARQA